MTYLDEIASQIRDNLPNDATPQMVQNRCSSSTRFLPEPRANRPRPRMSMMRGLRGCRR